MVHPREDNRPDKSISKCVIRLTHAKRKKGPLTIDPPSADPHGIPSHLIEHHPDPIDLVLVDPNRTVEGNLDHRVPIDFGSKMSVGQPLSLSIQKVSVQKLVISSSRPGDDGEALHRRLHPLQRDLFRYVGNLAGDLYPVYPHILIHSEGDGTIKDGGV